MDENEFDKKEKQEIKAALLWLKENAPRVQNDINNNVPEAKAIQSSYTLLYRCSEAGAIAFFEEDVKEYRKKYGL